MTERSDEYWTRPRGLYQQPPVLNPPRGQNANNAWHAIAHLGHPFEIEVYPTAGKWNAGKDENCDGRYERGEACIACVWGLIQPIRGPMSGGSAELQTEAGGEWSEGQIVVHLYSHAPENIKEACKKPDVFPDGIRLIGPDFDGDHDRQNFSTVIRWKGRRWKIKSIMDLFEGGDEDLHKDCPAVYRAICSLLEDRNHEREATPETAINDTYWGPSA